MCAGAFACMMNLTFSGLFGSRITFVAEINPHFDGLIERVRQVCTLHFCLDIRIVNTCGEASAARWNLIQALSSLRDSTSSSSSQLPHVVVASSLQEQLVPVLTALHLSFTSLNSLPPASQLTAAAKLVSHLGWTQVQQLQSWSVILAGHRYSSCQDCQPWTGYR
jgi:hypothetical protein